MKEWRETSLPERGLSSRWKNLLVRCSSQDCSLRWKSQPAVLNRFRGIELQRRWYHQTACLRQDLTARVRSLLTVSSAMPRAHRMPIGLLLVRRGAITALDLRSALQLQRQAGAGNLGYWLQQITQLDEEQICAALSQQWGCPVFPLDHQSAPLLSANVPPYLLLHAAKAVPAFAAQDGREWHIAFSERIDHAFLYACEQILQCKTSACVARASAVNAALDLAQKRAGAQICFDSMRDPVEIAAIICSYAAQMDARQIKVERAVGFIWAALFQAGARRDLLFRIAPEPMSFLQEPLPPHSQAPRLPADTRSVGVWSAGVSR